MNKRAILPNIFTLSNLFLGYWAIILTMQERFTTACWLIVIATIMDGLDGAVARWTRQSSKFGMQIDSLADSISFGLAPGLLVYFAVLKSLGTIGLILAFIPVLAGVLRLARYNLSAEDTNKKHHHLGFNGLPIPAAALVLIGYYLYVHEINEGIVEATLFFSLIPALSLLMISPIPYRRMPVIPINKSGHPRLAVGFLLVVTAVFLWNPALTIFPIMLIYILTGPFEWLLEHLQRASETRRGDDINDTTTLPRGAKKSRRNQRSSQ